MARTRSASTMTPTNGAPAAKLTKADAVRAALKDGADRPDAGVSYVKEKFGLDISKAMFSSYKTAEKTKGKRKLGRPPGRKSGTTAEVAAAPSSTGRAGKADVVDALEAIKQLVDQLGVTQVKRIADIFG